MWKIDSKDKHILRNKQDHIHINMWSMFVTVEFLYGTGGKRKEKRMTEHQ
jgi:hypothetical protein